MSLHDVIVIGSGPSGCSAAAVCRQAGWDVLIITDRDEVNDEPSSALEPVESIHPGVESLLSKIGATHTTAQAMRGVYTGIQAGNNYTALGADEHGSWQGLHIHRQAFDAQLLQHVQQAGVSVRFNERVERILGTDNKVTGVASQAGEAQAKFVIDASGHRAIGGKLMKWKRKFYSPPLVCWTGVSAACDSIRYESQTAHFIPGENSWTWLAPLQDNTYAWTCLSLKGEKTFSPPFMLHGCSVVGPITKSNMRWRMYRPLCSEGIVLCGDAGGVLDPAAGQGIFNALWSGMMAGNTVVSCLGEPDFAAFHLAQYDGWFVQQFEAKVAQLTKYYLEHGIQMNKE